MTDTGSRELAHHEPGGAVAARPDQSATIPMDQQLAMIREALTNPDVDPAKAREMFALMRDVQNDARKAEFNRAKIAAIRAMPSIYKRGANTHTQTRYAKFEDFHRAAMPVLAALGLTIDFRIGSEGRNVTVQPILRHENGYIEEGSVMAGPPDEGKGRSAIQAVGSASSYLKRYTMKAMLNIVEDGEEDTDGVLRPGDRLNDRQETLLGDAQAAYDAGSYADFFQKLPPKDRAVLVNSGTHSRLSGVAALPGSVSRPAPVPASPPPPSPPAPAPPPPADGQPDISTPEGWTEQYVRDLGDVKTSDDLRRVQGRGVAALGKLKAGHQELHRRAVEAGERAFQRVSGGQPAADDGLFAGGDE